MGFFKMKECSLCGGRLDSNNICVECGLDNSKSDANYISAGKTHRDSDAMTHVHTEYEPMAGKTVTKDWLKNAKKEKKSTTQTSKQSTYQSRPTRTTVKPKKKKSKLGIFIIIFVILAQIGPAFMNLVDEFTYGSYEPDYWTGAEVVLEDDPYAYVTYELVETGMTYEVDLTAGTYKGGVHIPEGTYEVTFIPEEGVEGSYADLSINDAENCIYHSFYFGDSEELYGINDFRVYTNGIVDVEGRGTLHFYSENAQLQDMNAELNPNTESYYLSGVFEVGVDVEPGVYDVICKSGSGIFDYEVETTNGYSIYCGKLIGDQESGFAGELKNIVLPEGTMVYIDEMDVTLISSEYIESEDYRAFYDNY